MEIAPSILTTDLSRAGDIVQELAEAGADRIHFDVMDGQFVPPITFGAAFVKSLRHRVRLPFEVHLMTLTPDRHFQAFVEAGCERVIFHAEAVRHAHRHAEEARQLGVQVGVAINPGTSIEVLTPLLQDIDMVLVMTVNPGWGGQRLIPSCLDKVRELRSHRPDLSIEVDGGIDDLTISAALEAGADVCVVGSFLTGELPITAAMQRLRDACASRF